MSSLINPFTAGNSLAPPASSPRFPISLPLSANAIPNVYTPVTVTLAGGDITNVLSALNYINSFAPHASNQFGIISRQFTALTNTLSLFNTLSAGPYTFTISQLQDIVTVSQMIRNWTNVNINTMTESNVISTSGLINTLTITNAGTNYTTGTYTNVILDGGSGSFATADITVSASSIASLGAFTPGTLYTVGSYSNVPLTGGSGTGATANIIVSGNGISTVGNIVSGGSYTPGTYTNVPLTGGSGTGATANITVSPSSVSTHGSITGGSSYLNGSYSNVPLTGGTGTGATANITVSGGSVVTVTIVSGGSGYNVGNTLSATNGHLGGNFGGAGFSTPVATVTGAVTIVSLVYGGFNYLVGDVLSAASANIGGTGSGFNTTVLTLATTGLGTVTGVTLVSGGTGYLISDILTASFGGGGTGFNVTVATIGGGVIITALVNHNGFGYKNTDSLTVLNTDLSSPNGTGLILTPATFLNTSIKTNITNFPSEATTLICNDGYFIVDDPSTGGWRFSGINDGYSWNLIDNGFIETRSDTVNAVDIFSGGTIVLFGTRSLEFWQDSGTEPLPFARITGYQQDWGLAAKFSRAYINNSIMFLGQNFQGQVQVLLFNGYVPERVSNDDIEGIINTFTVVNDAIALSYTLDGHEMYQLTFPTGNRTFLYDSLTGIWSEAQSSTQEYNRHLTSLATSYNYCSYASDCVNGNLYYLDSNNFTDNGSLIRREATSIHIIFDGNMFGVDEVYLDMQVGQGTLTPIIGNSDNPEIGVAVSKDNGNTFGPFRYISLGKTGHYKKRVVWRRFGSARDFVFKFVTTSPIPFTITYAAGVLRVGTEK